jgi:hypothetical protein
MVSKDERDLALYELVRHVAYADGQWLRHEEAFARAVAALGLRWDWREGLMQGETKVPNPYEEN